MDNRDVINEKGLCFYHAKFGKQAHSCRPGCKEAKASGKSGNAAMGKKWTVSRKDAARNLLIAHVALHKPNHRLWIHYLEQFDTKVTQLRPW